MIGETSIPCPECNTKIVISSSLLLQGQSFTCPNLECDVKISLNSESTSVVKDAMDKLNRLKQDE